MKTRIWIFPLSWVVAILGVLWFRPQVTLAAVALAAVGVTSYVIAWLSSTRMRGGGTAKHVAVALAIVLASFMVPRTYYWVTWNPVGDAYNDGWGWFPLPDTVETISSTSNDHGMVAVVTRTRGGLLVADTKIPYFVFVHKLGDADTKDNLAFRYDTTDAGWNSPPIVRWSDSKTVKIIVRRGTLLRVTAQRTSVDNISIAYSLPKPYTKETAWWQRPFL